MGVSVMPSSGRDLETLRVIQDHQLEVVEIEDLLELVGHSKLETPVTGSQLIAADANVLGGVGHVANARRHPVAHLAGAEEVGDELEPFPVPCVEEGARGRLAVELGHLRVTDFAAATLEASTSSAWKIPETHSTRTTSGA